MPFHWFSSSPFMLWYIAQLLLLLHICLSRDGNPEESIPMKRVISDPTQKDFSRYERKNVVETIHNTMKKIMPPFPKNETDYRSNDSHLSEPSLAFEQSNDFEGTKDRKRRRIEIPKSSDGLEEDGIVLSEQHRYSVKEIAKEGDPSETSSDALLLESLLDDILTERPTPLRKRALVAKKSPPKDSHRKSSKDRKSNSKKTKDKSRGNTVWKLETQIIEDKEEDSPSSTDESNPSESNDDSEAVEEIESDLSVTIESGVSNIESILSTTTEETDVDQDQLILSLLPFLPDDDTEEEEVNSSIVLSHETPQQQQPQNGTSGAPHFLILCIFGALSLLGIAVLIMGIYSAAIKYVSQRRYLALKDPLAKQNMSRINLADGLKPKKTVSNPKDVRFLLHAFLDVLEKNPVLANESLNQKYRSHAHFKAMKKMIRKTKIFTNNSV